jgi:uncharacterized damage-inducible protein DinB
MSIRPLVLTATLALCTVQAQIAPTNEELVDHWKLSKEFTLAVADAMPVEQYDFKVDEGEMSFAALMIHIAGSQAFRLAQVAGVDFPLVVPKEMPKEKAKQIAIDLLRQSFDFCIAQLSKLTPEQLAKSYKVDWFERPNATGRQVALAMLVHTAHHRGQAEVYLRAKGIKPPMYRF